MQNTNSDNEYVTCSLLGENFNLRCSKENKESLENAILELKNKASLMLRDNPNLSPKQVSIMIALDAVHSLHAYENNDTPFEKKAYKLIEKMKSSLIRMGQDD